MSDAYLWEILDVHDDVMIVDSFVKANSVINSPIYKTILCSISGGSDSDIMLDLITRVDLEKKVKYVWFDTGLEYQATKDHLEYLERKYNVTIERESYKAYTAYVQGIRATIYKQGCFRQYKQTTSARV